MNIHQFVPDFSYGDAIGNDAVGIQKILKRWGFESQIFSKVIHPFYRSRARYYLYYRYIAQPDDIILFHYSTGTELIDFINDFPCRKILVYHNITPADYFEKINRKVASRCRAGRKKLHTLTNSFELALGDSSYNKKELDTMGFPQTGVLPIIVDFSSYKRCLKKYPAFPYIKTHFPTLLHVGRAAPNKCLEDILKIVYFCQKYAPDLRLKLVGSHYDTETYVRALEEMIHRLNLSHVSITGHVSTLELVQTYLASSIYLCASEHEGFCVPLVEAMYFGIPIIAYRAAAVPETLGDAGLLFDEKDAPAMAEAVLEVLGNISLRQSLIKKGKARLTAFTEKAVAPVLKEHLKNLGVMVRAS